MQHDHIKGPTRLPTFTMTTPSPSLQTSASKKLLMLVPTAIGKVRRSAKHSSVPFHTRFVKIASLHRTAMCSRPQRSEGTPGPATAAATAARNLATLLTPRRTDGVEAYEVAVPATQLPEYVAPATTSNCREILSAIQDFVPTLNPNDPIFAAFHNGQVHDPLGGGSYAFQNDILGPVLSALAHDEDLSSGESLANNMANDTDPGNGPVTEGESSTGPRGRLPTRPIVIHAGLQPNNSPHAGTLVVFCYAFAVARGIRDRMQATAANTGNTPAPVSVEITFVDTAPVEGQGVEIGGVQYQRSYRDIPRAFDTDMADYEEVLHLLSTWSSIPFTVTFQFDFFSHPTVPSILRYIILNHKLLGQQLSPKYGTLALRAACPVPGCGLAEKHGRLNVYKDSSHDQSKDSSSSSSTTAQDATITFHCPLHGPYATCISEPADVARLEANAPARNLIRSMSHLLDASAHHVRVTGADYAGMYQEVFLYRPLAAWSAVTGLAAGRTPHILYAPLIVDWSGAKLSKTLYVRERGYQAMELFGTDGLCSFARLKSRFGGDGAKGLRRIWEEVERWVEDPRKLFRAYSVEYLQRVIMEEKKWES